MLLAEFPDSTCRQGLRCLLPGMLLAEFPDSACRQGLLRLLPRHAPCRISRFRMPARAAVPASPACCLPNFPIPHAGTGCCDCFSGMLLAKFPYSACWQDKLSAIVRFCPDSVPEKLTNPCDISVICSMLKLNHRKQQTQKQNKHTNKTKDRLQTDQESEKREDYHDEENVRSSSYHRYDNERSAPGFRSSSGTGIRQRPSAAARSSRCSGMHHTG